MRKYIFVTFEGFTYQPNSEGIEPDIENLQVIGFAEGDTARGALQQLLRLNEYLLETNFDEVLAIELASTAGEYLSLKAAARGNRAGPQRAAQVPRLPQ